MSTTADSNLSTIAFQRETVWGTNPGSPALALARFTSEDIGHDKTTVQSEEINPDRQITELIEVGAGASGTVNFEFSITPQKHWLEAAMMGELATPTIAGVTTGINHTTQTLTAASGTPFAGLIPGASYRMAGAATGANNGVKRVVSVGGGGATAVFAAGSFTATEASPSLTITGSVLKNGTAEYSYFLERRLQLTAGDKYQQFSGMQVDTYELTVESMKVCTGSIGFVGRRGLEGADDSLNGVTPYTAAATDAVVNGTTNVGTMQINGAAAGQHFKKIVFSIANGLRPKDEIGTKGAFEIGIGTFEVTGSFEAYFKDNALLDAFINHANAAFAFTITDAAGAAVVINFPRIKYSDANAPVTGRNTDVMQPIEWTATKDPTTGATMIVSFIPAP